MNSVKAKLLLVDDDPDLLRLLSIRLQGAGYAVSAVESAEAALSQVAVSAPDVVITDLRMGGMDGMALFESLQKKHPALPVIILTAHGTIPDAVAATQRGVFGYLTKPFEGKALIDQVEKALQFGGTPIANGVTDTSWRADIITRSPEMEAILAKARLVAGSDASVMIFGESGAGKEMLSRAIHKASARAGQPFVAVNCGAIPEQLLESELFGHVKGAFTGAASDYKGLFQAAGRGTVFLDEIGDMPLPLQVKLLRVLQEREVRPIGSTQSVKVDVRIISATHRNLEEAIKAGTFREDLYYRLHVVPIVLPPLRERREDIPLLVGHFLQRYNAENHKALKISSAAMELIVGYEWPGNVRELENCIERMVVMARREIIAPEDVPLPINIHMPTAPPRVLFSESTASTLPKAVADIERERLLEALRRSGGVQTRAATLLGITPRQLGYKLKKYHITPKMVLG